MDGKQEIAYSPKETRITLDIGDSTLRKWCIALEKNGYTFIKNEQGRRLFVERDLLVLRHFQKLLKEYNMQHEKAAILIIDRFNQEASDSGTGSVPAAIDREKERDLIRSSEEAIKRLWKQSEGQQKQLELQQEYIKKQEAFNKELLKRLDDQQKYIDERIEEKTNMLLEESQEKQRQLETVQAQQKKGFLARLFGG